VPYNVRSSLARDRWVLVLGAGISLLIFGIDLQMPLGAAVGVLYIVVILLGLWAHTLIYPLAAAGVATVLSMIDLAVGWVQPPNPHVYVNRPLMALTFWLTAVLVVRSRRLEITASTQVKELQDFKYALDQAAIVATTDVSGRITYVNDTFCAISKFSREELIGQDHRIVNSGYHSKEYIRTLWRTIGNGRVWHGELRNRAKDGTLYWVDTTIIPFLDSRGKPYQYMAIRSDITNRKAAEAQLREQESLARLGQMAAVVAHEVRNPLTGIKAALEIMRSRRNPQDADVPVMREIVSRVDALADLLTDLLLFANPRPLRLAPVDLQPLLADVVGALRSDPAFTNIDAFVEGPPAALTADREMLRAAIFNLALNGAQAMGGKGRLAVTVQPTDDHVLIHVRDEGPGIPPDLRDKIFEPFFTTKHRGGGLGLSITARTAVLHGGSLSCECPPSGGTVMTLILPRQPVAAVTPAVA
jgi:PAS domain S-box-containing protein